MFVVNDFGNKMSAFSSEFRSLPMRWHLLRLLLLPFPFLSRFPPGFSHARYVKSSSLVDVSVADFGQCLTYSLFLLPSVAHHSLLSM